MGATFINPEVLKQAANEQDIPNANQLSHKSGVNYQILYDLWVKGLILKSNLETVTRLCETLLISHAKLLTYSKDLNYGDSYYEAMRKE